MKRTPIFLGALFFLLVSFSAGSDKKGIAGTWKEWWGVGQQTDVTYHDIFFVKTDPVHNCELSGERKNYKFCKVSFCEGVLAFNLVNTNQYDTLPYKLSISPDGRMLKGTAISVYGEKKNVVWEKVDSEAKP